MNRNLIIGAMRGQPLVYHTRRRNIPWRLISWVVTATLIGAVLLFPWMFSPYPPNEINPVSAFQAPSLTHPFGTDESGRDLFSRVIWGARPSLGIGLVATILGLVIGTALALLGALSGWIGRVISARVIEVAFAFPTLLLALLIIAIAGPGPIPTTIAVALSTAPGYARIIREQVITVRASGYIEQATLLGHHPIRILGSSILPNALSPLITLGTLGIGQAIVWASALSFLGLGAAPPSAEWGAMLAAGRTYMTTSPWMTLAPGIAIVSLSVVTTFLGRASRARNVR